MKIVFWQMGDIEQKIFPTNAAVEKLREDLKQATNDAKEHGIGHFVWGPDIKCTQIDF